MKFTLIISGSGGQGVMSIGMSLAGSAVEGGLHATFMPLYGPEQRGGSAKCTVIVSDSEIVSPCPSSLTASLVMNETSFKKFTPELKPGGVLVRNINRHDLGPQADGHRGRGRPRGRPGTRAWQ